MTSGKHLGANGCFIVYVCRMYARRGCWKFGFLGCKLRSERRFKREKDHFFGINTLLRPFILTTASGLICASNTRQELTPHSPHKKSLARSHIAFAISTSVAHAALPLDFGTHNSPTTARNSTCIILLTRLCDFFLEKKRGIGDGLFFL